MPQYRKGFTLPRLNSTPSQVMNVHYRKIPIQRSYTYVLLGKPIEHCLVECPFLSNVRDLWINLSLGETEGTSMGKKLGRLLAGVDLEVSLAVVIFFVCVCMLRQVENDFKIIVQPGLCGF